MRFVGLLLVAVALLAGGDAHADAASRAKAQRIAGSLMSPFCPGRTLSSCSSYKAGEWRDDIGKWVQEGLTEEQIEARLQARVPGVPISSNPPGPWRWALPLLAVLVAGGAIAALARSKLRSRSEPAAAPPPAAAEAPDELRAELRRALEELD